jgi:exodeoxyribonuclease-3
MPLTVMSWNILQGGEARLDAIRACVRAAQPDLLALQECVGWEDGRMLEALAQDLGLPSGPEHVQLGHARPRGSGRRYHVALLSRPRIARAEVFNDPGFVGHALLRAELALAEGPLVVFATHFDAHHENLRFVEARHLRTRLDPAAFASGRYLLLGDLNSLSARDPYPPDFAALVQRAGTDKYGHPPRFEVIADLEAFGWVDVLRARPLSGTWVTAHRDRGGVAIDYRTDYIFASPPLAAQLLEARVVDVGQASDHQAVLARFAVEGGLRGVGPVT